MRLFLALELPDGVRQHLAKRAAHAVEEFAAYATSRGLDARLSAVPAPNLHVTVKFLGEVGQSRVAPLCDALGGVNDEPADGLSAGHLELLPPRGPVRVVAAGLDGDVGRLARLHRAIEDACAAVGFAPEHRAYLPHVTLARARLPVAADRRERLSQMWEGSFPSPPFRVDGFTLFESRLGGGPPVYTPVARFPR